MHKRKDIIHNNLKEYRLKAGLTQKEVCKKLGFTNTVALCHWEQGKNIPNLINVLKLSALFQTSIEALYVLKSEEIKKSLLNS